MESSEIPPKGERAAACIWNNETFTKSLDVVPRALFSRRHQCSASPSGGWTFASLPSAPHTLTRTGGTRRWLATGAGELFGLWVIPLRRCWQTTEREIAATSAPRWRLPSSFRCENFRFCDRVAHRGLPHHAAYTACGRAGLGVGTASRLGSLPHNARRALDFASRVSTSWCMGLFASFYCPLRPSASLGSLEGLRPRQRCMRRAALTANGRRFLQSQCSSYLGIIATASMPTPVLLITAAMTALARGWLSSNPQSSADRMMLSVVAHRAGDPHRPPLNAPQVCRLKRQSCGKRQFSRMP